MYIFVSQNLTIKLINELNTNAKKNHGPVWQMSPIIDAKNPRSTQSFIKITA